MTWLLENWIYNYSLLNITITNKAESVLIRDTFELSFDFRTNAKNAILAIVVDDNTKDSFFMELYDSQVRKNDL